MTSQDDWIYVLGNNKFYIFDQDHDFKDSSDGFNHYSNIASDGQFVYITGYERIHVFTKLGAEKTEYSILFEGYILYKGIAVDGNYIYVTDASGSGQIFILNKYTGSVVKKISDVTDSTKLDKPTCVTTDDYGNIYVADDNDAGSYIAIYPSIN